VTVPDIARPSDLGDRDATADETPITILDISDRTTLMRERERAEEGLRESMDALRRSEREREHLLRQLVGATEAERARFSGEVHDDSLQAMAAVGLRLETFKRGLGDVGVVEREEIEALQSSVSAAVRRLRELLFDLRPPSLDASGVAMALGEFMDRIECPTSLDAAGFEEPPQELRTVFYRVAQEALANVRKHAEASAIHITLSSDSSAWRMRIADDGRGFEASDVGADEMHVGLASIRARAEMGGGTLRIESAPDEGTTIDISLPRPTG
jgi:signal transduction histidine kinase